MVRKEFEINLDEIAERAGRIGRLEKLEEELYFFARLVNTNYELKTTLENIGTQTTQKKEIIREIMPGETSDLFFEIVDNLIEAEKFNQLYKITSTFSEKVAQYQNVSLGELITAIPVSEHFVKKVQLKLSGLAGGKIRLKNFVDSDLVGGLVVKLKGGRIIDTSIRRKLEELKNCLTGEG